MREKQVEKARTGADNGQEDTVRLKPIMGLRPGIYLAVIYSVILLAILFFILVYPGLVRPGSVVVLKTEPAGAALRVDGVYRGTAPDTVFVPRGKHTLELVLPGFTTKRIECDIPGRLLFSALFPRRYPLEVTLTATDPAAAFIPAAKDYAEWTFGGEPTAAWQIPLSLSEGSYRAGVAAASRPGAWNPEELLKASARFAVTGAALRDLLRAKVIADNGGLPPSPLSLTRSASAIIGFLSENPGSAVWLAETLPAESAVLLTASSWYQARLAAFTAAEESLSPPPALSSASPAGHLAAGGLSFTGMAEGTLVQGEPFPHAVPVEGFMISDTEVPSSLFAEFLADNPRWRADQREALAAEDLVTGDYLVDYGTAVGPDAGVTGVSWYAARAFCEWFGERLPPSMNGYEVRLPAEAEWEYAAKPAKRWAAASEIKHMEDGAWEWCLDPYVPLPFINAAPGGIAAIGSPERSVRGGSPLNPAGPVTPETRASLPPAFCSPFVSFRVVIAPAAGRQPSAGRQGTTGFPAQPALR